MAVSAARSRSALACSCAAITAFQCCDSDLRVFIVARSVHEARISQHYDGILNTFVS